MPIDVNSEAAIKPSLLLLPNTEYCLIGQVEVDGAYMWRVHN